MAQLMNFPSELCDVCKTGLMDDNLNTIISPLPFDGSDSGLWNGCFVPPPPRPPYMDDELHSESLVGCNLCSWSCKDRTVNSIEGSLATGNELEWAFRMTIIVILSTIIAAIVMIILLRLFGWKRQKQISMSNQLLLWWCRKPTNNNNSDTVVSQSPKCPHPPGSDSPKNPKVWIWLKDAENFPHSEQMATTNGLTIGNYYTNTDDSIGRPSKINEVLYEEISGIG